MGQGEIVNQFKNITKFYFMFKNITNASFQKKIIMTKNFRFLYGTYGYEVKP